MKKLLPPYLFLSLLIGMLCLWTWLPLQKLVPFPFNLLGLLLIFLGLKFASSGKSLFKKVDTNINTFKNPDILVTEGPFKFTRNPMYLGFLLVLIGFAWCFGVISVWVGPLIFLLLANFWYIPFEEKRMLEKFGDSYVGYRQKVRRWL